jgi:hypothetical protein
MRVIIRIAVLRSIVARVLCFSLRNCGRGMRPVRSDSCPLKEYALHFLKLNYTRYGYDILKARPGIAPQLPHSRTWFFLFVR